MTRFIVVVGGVLSGVGKGVITSSIGKLLKSKGYSVTAVKIDPYLNIDAGTMRPTEHGEVWVTHDGGEIDQDLGNYERFLDVKLGKDNNITTGKVYLRVIEKERRGDYLGTDVRVIPHVVNEVKQMIYEQASGYDFCLVEVGGTTGDLENKPFLEAVRRIKWVDNKPILYIMVAYLPILNTVGEQKTKPAQHALKALMETGIYPDFLVTRSQRPIDETRRRNLRYLASIKDSNIIDVQDVDSIYKVPLILESQGVGDKILKHFSLPRRRSKLRDWIHFVNRLSVKDSEVNVALVGKYVSDGETSNHEDVYISVKEALVHAGAANGTKVNLKQVPSNFLLNSAGLKDFDAVIVPGGFGSSGVEGKIEAIRYCRETGTPYLGLCYGMQLAVVEFARNVCGWKDAHTVEVNPSTQHPVIDILPEQMDVTKKGGTMRLGEHRVEIKENTKAFELYGSNEAFERFRHRWEVNPVFIEDLESKGMVFSGKAPGVPIMQVMELPNHLFFMASQFHPEFTSRPNKPNPLFKGLVEAAMLYKAKGLRQPLKDFTIVIE